MDVSFYVIIVEFVLMGGAGLQHLTWLEEASWWFVEFDPMKATHGNESTWLLCWYSFTLVVLIVIGFD